MGNVHYNEDMPPAIHNTACRDGQGRWAGPGDRPSPTGLGPQRGMATSSVSGKALAPWPWPFTPGGGEGGRDRGAVAHVGVQCPASPGPLARRSWHLGDGDGVPPSAQPPLSGSPPCEGSGHFLLCSVSWNFVLVYRRWKPFLVMVSSEWNFTRTESPAEYTSSGG